MVAPRAEEVVRWPVLAALIGDRWWQTNGLLTSFRLSLVSGRLHEPSGLVGPLAARAASLGITTAQVQALPTFSFLSLADAAMLLRECTTGVVHSNGEVLIRQVRTGVSH